MTSKQRHTWFIRSIFILWVITIILAFLTGCAVPVKSDIYYPPTTQALPPNFWNDTLFDWELLRRSMKK